MSVINTNITSMIGQSNLNKSQNALQTSMERLSSGLRINSAKDDAAGQAIANRMTAQINGLAQAQRNANDGISVAQTAEGALNQINDNLQRVRELTVQAQNGTNSPDDLQSIQDEIDQRLAEINRISEETTFNSVEVLNTDSPLQIQVGANDGETISVNLRTINATELGINEFKVGGYVEVDNDAATTTDLTDLGFTAGSTTDGVTEYTGTANQRADLEMVLGRAAAGDTVAIDSGDTYIANGEGDFYVATDLDASSITITSNDPGGSQSLEVDEAGNLFLKVDNDYYAISSSEINAGAVEIADFDALTALTGDDIPASTTTISGASEQVVLSDTSATTAADVETAIGTTNTTISLDGVDYNFTDADGIQRGGEATYLNADSDTLVEDDGGQVSYFEENGNVTDENGRAVYVDGEGSLTTNDTRSELDPNATPNPLRTLDDALKEIDSLRSELGAVQNRFEDAITNLNTNETNLAAARSRIEDADYAVEVANMTRAQILQQAGTSVLAQANQIPQNVLSLLG